MGLIDDIKRDREAGTPGALNVTILFVTKLFTGRFKVVVATTRQHRLADARRIARVPDMEAALIAAEELAAAIDSDNPRAIGFALAAYRKATEADQ